MALSLFRLPALDERLKRFTPNRFTELVFLPSPETFFVTNHMTAFSIEPFTYSQGSGQTNKRTLYQLVGLAAGPGWGADLSRLEEPTHRFATHLRIENAAQAAQLQAQFNKANPQITSTNLLGATEGKYVLLAGFEEDFLQERLDYIFRELDGGRSDPAADNVEGQSTYSNN